ncbi:ribosome-binding protein, partial [Coemansia sp. RSA 2703]
FEMLSQDDVPSVVLVKKSYSERRRKRKNRNWRLKTLDKDDGELAPKKQDKEKLEADFETFLRDLEEDPELRQNINLYKDAEAASRARGTMDDDDMVDSDDGEDVPEVPLEELLEDLKIGADDDEDNDDEMGM